MKILIIHYRRQLKDKQVFVSENIIFRFKKYFLQFITILIKLMYFNAQIIIKEELKKILKKVRGGERMTADFLV